MRQLCERLAPTIGSCLLLVVTTAVSVGLNTDLAAPPRFDGAGYTVLGEALASGRGYREINEPESPRHDHFPPGYPLALAALRLCAGRSVAAAHLFSALCTITAVLMAWRLFRTFYSPRPALMLGMALALNWTWGRVGGSIQSEPFFMLWELLAVMAIVEAGRRDNVVTGIALGLALAACILIRHVGVCIAAAAFVELGLRGRWKTLLVVGLTTGVLIAPWVIWLAIVHHNTQIGLFTQEKLVIRVVGQIVFYIQRLPDQVTGPFVEVGTASHRARAVAVVANLWAALATGIMTWGWVRTVRSPRRRLAGMIMLTTIALLLVWPFTEAGRFLIPLVPFLLVGLMEGIADLMARTRLKRCRERAVALILAVSIPYSAYAIANGRARAQRLAHADVDGACEWISHHQARLGPVLTRQPGEVFWQTGRPTVGPDSADPDAIDRQIDRLGVVYLMIDENRYVNAALNPLEQYVERYPDRVMLVWSGRHGDSSVRVFETKSAKSSSPSREVPVKRF